MTVEIDGANNIVKTNTISEVTSANGVTVDGLNIKDSKLVTADSVITTNITDANVTLDKIKITGETQLSSAPATGDELIIYDASASANKRINFANFTSNLGGASLTGSTNNTITTVTGANAIQGETNLQFDGEVLKVLGNPSTTISQVYNLSLENDTDGATSGDAKTGILFRASYNDTTPTDLAGITGGKENNSNGDYASFISLNTRTNGVNTIAQRLIVDSSGRVNINTASAITGEGVLQVKGNSSQNVSAFQVATNGNVGIRFFNSSTSGVGSITVNSSSTSYGTSSDYRLKENAVAISDGITRLKTLKPYRFNFKTEPDTKVDGFFAHEVTAVPEAVTGTKDAMAVETRYTADDVETQGDTPSKKVGDAKTYSSTEIDAQGIDQSKLVPLLTSALQEAITKIETLEAKVTALENA